MRTQCVCGRARRPSPITEMNALDPGHPPRFVVNRLLCLSIDKTEPGLSKHKTKKVACECVLPPGRVNSAPTSVAHHEQLRTSNAPDCSILARSVELGLHSRTVRCENVSSCKQSTTASMKQDKPDYQV